MGRILVWFSCGAASAVAAKVIVERYAKEQPVEVVYCDTSRDEHPDNARFMAEVASWIGQPVKVVGHPKYRTVNEVFRDQRYIVGPMGAACTKRMKREVREAYQRPDDTHVFGFTHDERGRVASFIERNPEVLCLWPLLAGRVTKNDCYRIIQAAGIELPVMYRLGYNNNNCIGCVKGGMGYWNRIRKDFPGVFAARAAVEREVGATCLRDADGERLYLDQLPPGAGRFRDEPSIECGIFCDGYSRLIDLSVSAMSDAPVADAGETGEGKGGAA